MKKLRRIIIARFLSVLLTLSVLFFSRITYADGELWSLVPKNQNWIPSPQGQGIDLDRPTVAELEELYKKLGYDNYVETAKATGKIPAVFLKHFPVDYDSIKTDEDRRNQLFIKILAPLGVRLNASILQERTELEQMIADFEKNDELNETQIARLEQLAQKYDHFTPFKGHRRYKLLLAELRTKIDILPASFYIAFAAAETDWGTSRIVKEGNALYKELVWYTDKGLKPIDETEDDTYRIRIFPTLYAAMESFALKVNSNINYKNFRLQRKEHRYRRQLMTGRNIAHTMLLFTPLKNYIGLIDYTTTFYELVFIDSAKLFYPKNPLKNNEENTKHTSE